MATAAAPPDDPPSDYYDILMLGRTGQGKSTTANKLLEIESRGAIVHDHKISESGVELSSEARGQDEARVSFETGDGMDSITTNCKLISNEMTNIRVLDTPGFAGTWGTREHGVFKGNLQIFRSILRAQDEVDLAFCRVLYFLPLRGALERADGILQEEIKLMYGFLGEEVFKIMVIIATNRRKKNGQQDEFNEDDIQATEKVFMTAFERITGEKDMLPKCPPILYLPFLEENVINRVVAAPVIYEEPLKVPVIVEFSATTPSIKILIQEAKQKYKGKKLQFRDRCTKCSGKIIYEDTPRGRKAIRIALNESENETVVPYNDSKCHPVMLPKHYSVTKVIGGIAHLATLGIFIAVGKIRGKKVWPGFTNHDELCAGCNGPAGAEGCTKVNKKFKLKAKKGSGTFVTNHSTVLDKLQINE